MEPFQGWASFNFDAENSRHNRHETLLSPFNAPWLVKVWSVRMDPGVTSTPAVVDGVAYACSHTAQMFAVRAVSGELIWQAAANGMDTRCSSPLVVDDMVYFASGAYVVARDRHDGSPRWSTQVHTHPDALIDSSPVLARDAIIIGVASAEMMRSKPNYDFRGSVVALDPKSGEIRWMFFTSNDGTASGAGVGVWSSAAVDEGRGLLFIGTGQAYERPAGPLSDSLLAIDIDSGELIWSHQFHEDDVYTDSMGCGATLHPCEFAIGAAPNLFTAAGRDLVGAGSKGGVYKALDRDTGGSVWEAVLGPGSEVGGVMAVAAVGDDSIYVSQNDRRQRSTLFALATEDGNKVWKTEMSAPTWGAITLANGLLYVPTYNGIAHIVDAGDGHEVHNLDLEYEAVGGLSVVDGMVFAPSGYTGMFQSAGRGELTAFALP